ncbi:hypothetical protein ACFFGH_05855 [Lysobacter korlensis]|uniref:TonB C-terminal domain-containing protein n=1 Tax=Lysobacter korlensis TaxID=553636 RepID=A0ABV6RK57_9GAMM
MKSQIRIARTIAVATATAWLCACATTSPAPVESTAPARDGRVGAEDITGIEPAQARLVLAANEAFHPPLEEPSNAMPTYPQALLAQQLPPQAICLQVSIGPDGAVMFSRPLKDRPGCDAPVDAAFDAAAAETVAGWRFDPAFKCVFADEATKLRDGPGCGDALMARQAVSLVYRFEFSQREGQGMVQTGSQAAP